MEAQRRRVVIGGGEGLVIGKVWWWSKEVRLKNIREDEREHKGEGK